MCIVEITRFKMQKEDKIVPSVCVENRYTTNDSMNPIPHESQVEVMMNTFQEVMNRMQDLENSL